MTTNTEPFPYKDDLAAPGMQRSIRILDILPGQGGDQISCELRRVSLDEKPAYEALSYCWGPPTPTVTITCDGSPITIGMNLGLALKAIRESEVVHIWADAICINQAAGAKEKEYQIPLMNAIYKQATVVKIWLGDEDVDTRPAFEYLQKIRSIGMDLGLGNVKSVNELSFNFQARNHMWHPASYGPDENPWLPLFRLFQRDWFSRVWVIQEAALAPKAQVICGRNRMDWEDFEYALHTMSKLLSGGEDLHSMSKATALLGLPLAIIAAKAWISKNKPRRLVDLLIDHHRYSATNKLDHIYGLGGIASDVQTRTASVGDHGLVTISIPKSDDPATVKLDIVVNYDAPPTELFTQVAGNIIMATSSLELLGAVERTSESDSGQNRSFAADLPSWVPDWSSLPRTRLFCRALPDIRYAASGLSGCKPHVRGKELILSGYAFDEVVATFGDLTFSAVDTEAIFSSAKAFDEVLVGIEVPLKINKFIESGWGKRYITGEKTDKAAYITLRAGAPGDEYNLYMKGTVYLQVLLYHVLYQTGFKFLFKVAYCLSMILFIPIIFTRRDLSASQGDKGVKASRQIFRSKTGYMGLGPENTKEGDRIVLLEGGKMAVIGQFLERSNAVKFRGEAYVHGLMNGEQWDSTRCEEIRLI